MLQNTEDFGKRQKWCQQCLPSLCGQPHMIALAPGRPLLSYQSSVARSREKNQQDQNSFWSHGTENLGHRRRLGKSPLWTFIVTIM